MAVCKGLSLSPVKVHPANGIPSQCATPECTREAVGQKRFPSLAWFCFHRDCWLFFFPRAAVKDEVSGDSEDGTDDTPFSTHCRLDSLFCPACTLISSFEAERPPVVTFIFRCVCNIPSLILLQSTTKRVRPPDLPLQTITTASLTGTSKPGIATANGPTSLR